MEQNAPSSRNRPPWQAQNSSRGEELVAETVYDAKDQAIQIIWAKIQWIWLMIESRKTNQSRICLPSRLRWIIYLLFHCQRQRLNTTSMIGMILLQRCIQKSASNGWLSFLIIDGWFLGSEPPKHPFDGPIVLSHALGSITTILWSDDGKWRWKYFDYILRMRPSHQKCLNVNLGFGYKRTMGCCNAIENWCTLISDVPANLGALAIFFCTLLCFG